MTDNLIFDKNLIKRYDKTGPRYTSYPTAIQFREGFNHEQLISIIDRTNEDLIPRPLSLYFHLPFCSTVCYYCACNKIVRKNRDYATPYLASLHKEIAVQGKLYDEDRTVEQLHWGGGTPTYINDVQIQFLMELTRKNFSLLDDDQGEYSIEIDPRETNKETISLLRTVGFNRISLGVQDFDREVQEAVNRIQSEEETVTVIDAARDEGFKSIGIDLIYGLPKQNAESFSTTLNKIIAMQPDRLSIFNYAHMPSRFKIQNQISEDELPPPAEKLNILQEIINILTNAGYIYIGMDHFAKPGNELARAQENKTLTRNFQGYSTHADCDIIGMGITAISKIGDCYVQNTYDIKEYGEHLNNNKLPVYRGIKLDSDDLLRRDVIIQMICHFKLEFNAVEEKYHIEFNDYFYNELQLLKVLEEDELLAIDTDRLTILPKGRLLIRSICMIFDKYQRQLQNDQIFSRII